MIMEQGQVGRDGRFSFTTLKPSDLIVTASSPDLKRSGRLDRQSWPVATCLLCDES